MPDYTTHCFQFPLQIYIRHVKLVSLRAKLIIVCTAAPPPKKKVARNEIRTYKIHIKTVREKHAKLVIYQEI